MPVVELVAHPELPRQPGTRFGVFCGVNMSCTNSGRSSCVGFPAASAHVPCAVNKVEGRAEGWEVRGVGVGEGGGGGGGAN